MSNSDSGRRPLANPDIEIERLRSMLVRVAGTGAATVVTLAAMIFCLPLLAATPIANLRHSPDTTTDLDGVTVADENAVSDDLAGTVTVLGLGALPPGTDLDAYHRLPGGDQLVSFDTVVDLPGGVLARPGDVVRFDGAVFTLEFEAAAYGISAGANVDAVTGFSHDSLLLSFDISLDLGGVVADDEDLVLFDGVDLLPFFDGSTVGVMPGLDLDGAHFLDCNGNLLLSFDLGGTVDAVSFDDEDVLEYTTAQQWELAYDGSASRLAGQQSDLDALHATVDLGSGPPIVFDQTIVASSKFDFEWMDPADFRAVRGDFITSTNIGNFEVNASVSGNGTLISDLTAPLPGTGSWYLVRPGGCRQASWQTALGSESGRDPALP